MREGPPLGRPSTFGSRPVSGLLSAAPACAGVAGWPSLWDRRRRRPRAAYPEARTLSGDSGGRPEDAPCLALLRTGFTEPRESPLALVGSYPTVSPLPAPPTGPGPGARPIACGRWRYRFCGTVPGSLRVGVTHRPALRRPDFPRPDRFRSPAAATRPASFDASVARPFRRAVPVPGPRSPARQGSPRATRRWRG